MLLVQRSVQLFLDFARQARDSDGKVEMPDNVGWITALPEGGFVGHTHPYLAIGQCAGQFISPNLLLYTYDFIVIQPVHCAAVRMREGEYRSVLAVDAGGCTALQRSVAAENVPDPIFQAIDLRPGQRLTGALFVQAGDDLGPLGPLWRQALDARLGGEPCRHTCWHNAVASVLDQLVSPPFTGHVRAQYIRSKGTELLCELSVPPNRSHHRRTEVLRVCDRMAADLSVPLSIADHARFVGLSMGHLMRLFKVETGMTMRDYHLDLRLRRATTLLCQSKAQIQEVACALGFADAAHFSKSFKRKYGQTPNSIRHKVTPERRHLSAGNIGVAH